MLLFCLDFIFVAHVKCIWRGWKKWIERERTGKHAVRYISLKRNCISSFRKLIYGTAVIQLASTISVLNKHALLPIIFTNFIHRPNWIYIADEHAHIFIALEDSLSLPGINAISSVHVCLSPHQIEPVTFFEMKNIISRKIRIRQREMLVPQKQHTQKNGFLNNCGINVLWMVMSLLSNDRWKR